MKILVADDESDIKILVEQRFRKEIKSGGMDFIFANSGNEALAYLNNQSHEFVLILSDINMPGMSGDQTNIPEATTNGDDYNYKQAISPGVEDFLTKPLDFIAPEEKLRTKE